MVRKTRKQEAGNRTSNALVNGKKEPLANVLGSEIDRQMIECAAEALGNVYEDRDYVRPSIPAPVKMFDNGGKPPTLNFLTDIFVKAVLNKKTEGLVLDVLFGALEDKNVFRHKNAAKVLGKVAQVKQISEVIIDALVKSLGDKKNEVRSGAAWALKEAAEDGADITIAIPALVKGLEDKVNLRNMVAMALKNAVINEKNRGIALEAVVKALGDNTWEVRFRAIEILIEAAEGGADITIAIPALVKALRYRTLVMKIGAAHALGIIAVNADEENKLLIVKTLMDFVASDWFIKQTNRNSNDYILMAKELDKILKRIQELEQAA